MKFTEILNQTLQYWPSEISITDASNVDDDSGSFPKLSNHWDNAEFITKNEPEWVDLMVWAIFCGLHRLAIREYKKGESSIIVHDLDKYYVAERFEESLFIKDSLAYKLIGEEYINDL